MGTGPRVHTAREPRGSSGTLPHHTSALAVGPHRPPSPGVSRRSPPPTLSWSRSSHPSPCTWLPASPWPGGETIHPLHPHPCPPLSLQAEPPRPEQSHHHPSPPGLWATCPVIYGKNSSLLPAPVATPPGTGHFMEASNLTAGLGQSTPFQPPHPTQFPREQRPALRPHGAHSYLQWLQQQNPWTAQVAGKAQGSGFVRGRSGATTRAASEAARWLLADLKYLRWGQ